MASSHLFMSWTNVTFTPFIAGVAGSLVPLDEVTEVDFDLGGTAKDWRADGSNYCKAKVVRDAERKATIMGGNVGLVTAIKVGMTGTLVAVLNDLYNGTGSGAITHTMVNAVCVKTPYSGKNNEYATVSWAFESFMPDGQTDPLTTVQAP